MCIVACGLHSRPSWTFLGEGRAHRIATFTSLKSESNDDEKKAVSKCRQQRRKEITRLNPKAARNPRGASYSVQSVCFVGK